MQSAPPESALVFFFILPTGLARRSARTALLSWIVLGLVLYRFLLALGFEGVRIQIISLFPLESPGWTGISMLIQSAFSPVILPGINPGEHLLFICFAVFGTLLFWVLFGPSLEDVLGRTGFALLYLLGCGAGIAMLESGEFEISGVFWLGHAALLVMIGAAYALFAQQDASFHYFGWFLWAGSFGGRTTLPSLLVLIPIHLIVMIPQSLLWYGDGAGGLLAVERGPVPPFAWQCVLPIAGAAYALGARALRERAGANQKDSAAV